MKKGNKKKRGKFFGVLEYLPFLIYFVVLAYFLFFSESFGRTEGTQGYQYNLKLFNEITRYLEYHLEIGWKSVFINLGGNVMVLMPFGYFLPLYTRKRAGFLTVLCSAFLLSLTIEVIQLIFRVGIFDVDDIFLNSLGGCIGFFIYRIVHTARAGLLHSTGTHDPANIGQEGS